jgi:hypothetical protein
MRVKVKISLFIAKESVKLAKGGVVPLIAPSV